ISRRRLGERQEGTPLDGAAGLRSVHQGEPRLQSARRARGDLSHRATELHIARARAGQSLWRGMAGDGRRGRPVTQGRLLRQAPILFASSLRSSIAYWADRLGVEKHGIFGDPPEFAILKRDNCFVMLRQAGVGQKIVPYWQLNSGLWNAYFWVDDATV